MLEPAFTFDGAARRIEAALAARPARRIALDGFRPAAVLVPLLRRPTGPTLLFTQRTDQLRKHGGQVSFPGGHLEDGEDARSAALREAGEEVGLQPERVRIAGQLDDRPSTSRFVVTPVVGLVSEPPAAFRLDEREVREVFEVALERFADPGALRTEWWDASRLPPGLARRPLVDLAPEEQDPTTGRYAVYFFQVAPGRVIWGLTARVLKELVERALSPRSS